MCRLRAKMRRKKKFGPFLDLCVSSLRRGHANLLCIVPILSDVSEGTSCLLRVVYKCCHFTVSLRCGTRALNPSKVKTGAMARPKLLLIHLLILVGFLWRVVNSLQMPFFFLNDETDGFKPPPPKTQKKIYIYNIISGK